MKPDIRDLLIITGAAISLAGFFMLAHWLALAVCGLYLLIAGVMRDE